MTPCADALLEVLRQQGGDKRARSISARMSAQGFTIEEVHQAKEDLSVREKRTLLGTFWSLPPTVRSRKKAPPPLVGVCSVAGCTHTTAQRHPETGERMCLACQTREGVI